MRLQPLYDLQQEINRLFIAGSKFAKGDLRLQKQLPVLQKLGEKAPVFARLATDIEALIQAEPSQSAERLSALSTLLYSVLYTQGETIDENLKVREQTPFIRLEDVNTNFSYLQLRPVIQALSTSNSGRLEILKEAKARGLFNDSRTFQYLDYALADKYGELADYVEKTIIPEVGQPMIPFLRQSFRYEDKTANVRRLRLLDQLDDPGVPSMIDKILSESLPQLQAEAVIILAKDPSNEPLIQKLADDKNKLVREAAYEALAKIGTKSAFERLKDIYLKVKNKTQLPGIVHALATSKIPYFFGDIFTEVKNAYDDFCALDKTTDDKVLLAKLERFSTLVEVLRKKDEPEVDEFFVRILTDPKFIGLVKARKTLLEETAYHVMYSVTRALANRPDEKAIEFYERYMPQAAEASWHSHPWMLFLLDAVKVEWPKERIYERFYTPFQKGYLNINCLYNAFTNGVGYYYYYNSAEILVYTDRIDPRWWKDLYAVFPAKKHWETENMNALIMLDACDPSKKCDDLLRDTIKYAQPGIQYGIFRMIIKRNIKERFDLIFDAVEKFPKNNIYMLGYLQGSGFWTQFPDKYADKFRKLAQKTKQELFSEIADEIANKPK